MSYYSYKLDEVLDMESSDYRTLINLMYINESRSHLKSFESNAYSNLKESRRNEIFKKHYKTAYPKDLEIKDVVKLSDLSRILDQ